MFAEVGLGVHQADQAVLDLQDDIGAFFDVLEERGDGLDGEVIASTNGSKLEEQEVRTGNSLQRGVRGQVDVVDDEDVVVVVRVAVGERAVPRHGWPVVEEGALAGEREAQCR